MRLNFYVILPHNSIDCSTSTAWADEVTFLCKTCPMAVSIAWPSTTWADEVKFLCNLPDCSIDCLTIDNLGWWGESFCENLPHSSINCSTLDSFGLTRWKFLWNLPITVSIVQPSTESPFSVPVNVESCFSFSNVYLLCTAITCIRKRAFGRVRVGQSVRVRNPQYCRYWQN